MSRLFKAIFFGFLIGIGGVLLSFFPFLHSLEENLGLDLLFRLRGIRQAPPGAVVVSIDRESSKHLRVSDNPNKWPRSLHARLVEKLTREGARVIVFDLYFREPTSAQEDNSFAEAIRKGRNVVLVERLRADEIPSSDVGGSYTREHRIVKIVKPIAPLSHSAVATAPFVLPRWPIKVNQYWTFHRGAGDSPTVPVVAFQLYALRAYDEFVRLLEKVSPNQAGKLPRDAGTAMSARGAVRFIKDIREIFESDPLLSKKMVKELEHSDLVTSDGNKYRLLKSLVKMYGGADGRYLNYYGPPRTVRTMSFHQALRLGEDSDSDEQINLRGKAVFVGFSETLLTEGKDSFHTVFSQANGVFVSGVEIGATAFLNLLEDAPVIPISLHYYVLTILVWGILVGVFCRMAATGVAVLGIVAMSILYLIAAQYQFKADGTWYPVVIPLFLQTPLGLFGAVLLNYCDISKERQTIRKALGYYVPNDVVNELARNRVDMKKGGQTIYGACLFSDVTGYTSLSEPMRPEEVRDFMHKYFEATLEPVTRLGGLVIDLKGDSILAIWKGAELEPTPRRQACLAALGIAGTVRRLNVPTRVSVHAGQIFLGNIGAGDHYEYAATGDTINTTARIDSLNQYLGTKILVSEEVIKGLDGFLTREAGSFRLKGKVQPIVVHELICCMGECEDKQKKTCELFSEALRAFRRQSWDEAKEKFQASIENSGEDSLSSFYQKYCDVYKKNPPGGGWNGQIDLVEK